MRLSAVPLIRSLRLSPQRKRMSLLQYRHPLQLCPRRLRIALLKLGSKIAHSRGQDWGSIRLTVIRWMTSLSCRVGFLTQPEPPVQILLRSSTPSQLRP